MEYLDSIILKFRKYSIWFAVFMALIFMFHNFGLSYALTPPGGLGAPPAAPANSPVQQPIGIDLTIQDVANIIIGLACWLLRVVGAIIVIFIIITGLRFLAAQSNTAKTGEALKSFQNVLIGSLVIVGVYVIIATVANAVGVSDFSFIPLVC